MRLTKTAILNSTFLLGGLLAAVVPACAATVKYSTSGTFSSTGTNVFDGTGGASITFDDKGSTRLSTPDTDNLGSFKVVLPVGGAITGSDAFTLTINQTQPSAGSGSFSTTVDGFTGTVSYVTKKDGKTGTLVLTFNETSITIAGITYTLEDLGDGGLLASDQLAIGSESGKQDVEALITVAPEPALYSLLGMGLAGLFVFGARRKKRDAAV